MNSQYEPQEIENHPEAVGQISIRIDVRTWFFMREQ